METINSSSIFSPATGFIKRGGFDWTCNPYVGCTFGCLYCYAMFLPQNRRPREEWGKWFQAKINAIELAQKQAKKLVGKAVYVSSVTDPYIPIEKTLQLTRGILEAMIPYQPRLTIQTRGPLVMRDVDVFQQFDAIRVNVSIPTDDEEIRKIFEPKAPPLEQRWQALREIKSAGIPIGICVTPMLPLQDADAFANRIVELAPEVVVTQSFHDANSGFGADTSDQVWETLQTLEWTQEDYQRCVSTLGKSLTVYEGEQGFFPPEAKVGR